MDKSVSVFVEGKADIRFLEDFIRHHFGNVKVRFVDVKGKDSIHLAENFFVQNTDQDGINLLIFDADLNYQSSYQNLQSQKEKLGIEFETFLFPNNSDIGALEELLLKMTVTEHQGIFDCFKPFNDCLKAKNITYNVPDSKTQIFSYLSFQKLESKEEKRDYLLNCWNLDAPYTQPLVDFLKQYLN